MKDFDIQHIAKLARLKVSQEEAAQFEQEMSGIVEMVEHLPAIDGALEVSVDNAMQLREDEVRPSMEREAILANAPSQEAGCFLVPKIVE